MEVTRMIVSSVCCVVLIVGVVSASSRLVTTTEHGRSQQRPASRFITVKRNTGAYDDDKKDEAAVDLHNKEFCVDVSAFKALEWVEKEGEECKTDFVKKCE